MKTNEEFQMKKIISTLTILAGSLAALPVQAAEGVQTIPQVTNEWRGAVTPYIWATTIGGSVAYGDTKLASVDYRARDVISNINFAAMLTLEAHHGRLGAMADIVFAKLNAQKSEILGKPNLSSNTTVEQGIYTFAATYTIHNTKNTYLDGLAGVRVMNVVSRTDLKVADSVYGASNSNAKSSTAPIAGLKGRVRLGDSDYFIPFYIDVGGMAQDTQVTTQQMIGIGHAYEWGAATIGFKNLYNRQKSGGITTTQSLSGVVAGLSIRF
jgi:hypothetical protein